MQRPFMAMPRILGYEFLRSAMAKNDYQDKGCDIKADEIFISDGAKCDSGNIQEIFAKDNKIAVCDPVYPVYVDYQRNGRAVPAPMIQTSETWSDVIYMPCTKETGFCAGAPERDAGYHLPVLPQQPHRIDHYKGSAAGMGGLCQ